MLRLGRRGVAPIVVLVILLASTGAAVATPVIADAAKVPADSPLYGLRRLGEQITMASTEDQMKARWADYVDLVGRGKGLGYGQILQEFKDKLAQVSPGDVNATTELVAWMQQQAPNMGLTQLKLARDFSEQAMKYATDIPGATGNLENDIRDLQDLENQFPSASPELQDNILARLRLITQHLKMIVAQFKQTLPKDLRNFNYVDNMLADVDVDVNVNLRMAKYPLNPENMAQFLDNRLQLFDDKLTEVQVELGSTPENTPGRVAAGRQVELATDFRDNAVNARDAGNLKKAIQLLETAWTHLQNAQKIIDHAADWDKGFRDDWKRWSDDWNQQRLEMSDNRAAGQYNQLLTKVQTELGQTPENAPGRQAAQQQIGIAIGLGENAMQAQNSGDLQKAVQLFIAASVHLRNAERILDKAAEFRNVSDKWYSWKEDWQQLQQKYAENLKQTQKDYQQQLSRMREEWQQQWGELNKRRPTGGAPG